MRATKRSTRPRPRAPERRNDNGTRSPPFRRQAMGAVAVLSGHLQLNVRQSAVAAAASGMTKFQIEMAAGRQTSPGALKCEGGE